MPVNAMLIPGPRHLQLMFTMYIDTWSGSLWKHACQMLYCLICFQTSIMATGELCLWLATLSLPPDVRVKVCRQKRPGTSSYKRSLFTMCKSLQQAYPPTAGSGEWALAFNQPSFFLRSPFLPRPINWEQSSLLCPSLARLCSKATASSRRAAWPRSTAECRQAIAALGTRQLTQKSNLAFGVRIVTCQRSIYWFMIGDVTKKVYAACSTIIVSFDQWELLVLGLIQW